VFECESKVFRATKKSLSLRTTIPEDIVQFLKLQAGSKVKWIAYIREGTVTVIIKKKTES